MRIFKKFPKTKTCPICNTNENKSCTLIAIVDTGDKSSKQFQNYEADIFHIACLDLWYDKNIIFQRTDLNKNEK